GSSGTVVPGKRPQTIVPRARIAGGFLFQPTAEVIHEPRVAPGVTGRIDRLLTPLDQALRIRETAFLLDVPGRGQQEHFGRDVHHAQLSALDFGRVVPEAGGLDLDQIADDEPAKVRERAALEA